VLQHHRREATAALDDLDRIGDAELCLELAHVGSGLHTHDARAKGTLATARCAA
jgi:hypothetical protein